MNSTRIMARAASGIAVLLFAITASVVAFAQESRGDESYAVFVSQRNGAAELYLIDLNTRQVSQLTNTGRGHLTPAISSNRSIVFASREGSNYEIFSGTLGSAIRTRRPTMVGVNRLTVNTEDETAATTTRDGVWVSFLSGKGIEIMTAGGMERRVIVPASELSTDFAPAISPDGSRVAFVSNRGGEYEVWMYSKANGELSQLTRNAKVVGGLSWSADGQQIVFNTTATVGETSGIAMANAETGSFRVLTDKGDFNGSLSVRGDRMLFTSTRDGDAEIYLLNVGSGSVERLTFNSGMDDGAVFVTESVRPGRPTR
ncbi:MAG: PD40 domain-containing protein [Acidobacteria bacterium]|nr:PD40 domain-containing protein [Acidobacteriota bacterium]